MRMKPNRFGRDVMRAALAAMLLVATVAGARLEAGMAAARASGLPPVAMLCSGKIAVPDEAGTLDERGHCGDCTLPGGLAPAVPLPVYAPGFTGKVAATVSGTVRPDIAPVHYSARAPPGNV